MASPSASARLTGAPAEAAALRRAFTAALRWRVRWLRGAVPARTALAARAVPLLFHASFEGTALRGEAPGVSGQRYRRSWLRMARELSLPSPTRPQRGAPLVEAVLALPTADGLEVAVVVAPALHRSDSEWVRERAAAVEALLARAGVPLVVRVTDPVRLARDPTAPHRAVAFAALVGGGISAGTWSALESSASRAIEPRVLAALAGGAVTPLAHLSLALLAGRRAPAPLAAAARLLRRGEPARRIADPARLFAAWAADAGRGHDALLAAQAIADGEREADVPTLLALGRTLACEAAGAVRRARRVVPPAVRGAWLEAVGPGLPHALRPALAARLASGPEPLRTALVRDGAAWEVRLAGGPALGRGATPVQARVRALAVLAGAAPEALAAHAEPPWRAVVSRLAARRERATLLVVVEPAGPSGPPFDPLNRGPSRALGFGGGLAVRLRPGVRPSARVLVGDALVARVLAEASRGGHVEVVPARPEANPVAARLSQVAALAREARTGRPVAFEAGGAVLVASGGRLRRHALDRFLARPRAIAADPDAPDLALAPGERRPIGIGAANVVECRAQLVDASRAAVLYADARGGLLRETVFLWELEDHLRSARAILQAADPSAALAVRLSEDVEPALRRAGPAGPAFTVSVRGAVPLGLEVEVGGTRFGGASGRTWRDAADAVLATWRRGEERRLAVGAVTVAHGGRRAGGLLALWARSVALRRLRQHLVSALRPYRDEAASRRTG